MRFERGDLVVYCLAVIQPDLGLTAGQMFRVREVVECGGPDCQYAYIDIGLTHSAPFTFCAKCNNIVAINDIYHVPAFWFRAATDDERDNFHEYIISKSLTKHG